jgi:hypothetical protein
VLQWCHARLDARFGRELPLSGDQELFDQVGAVLATHGDWHYEPSTAPGGLPSWCLDPGGKVLCSINVVDGAIVLYIPEEDRELRLDGLDGLTAWLEARAK